MLYLLFLPCVVLQTIDDSVKAATRRVPLIPVIASSTLRLCEARVTDALRLNRKNFVGGRGPTAPSQFVTVVTTHSVQFCTPGQGCIAKYQCLIRSDVDICTKEYMSYLLEEKEFSMKCDSQFYLYAVQVGHGQYGLNIYCYDKAAMLRELTNLLMNVPEDLVQERLDRDLRDIRARRVAWTPLVLAIGFRRPQVMFPRDAFPIEPQVQAYLDLPRSDQDLPRH